MEQTKNLELEILLALKTNKSVPTRKFHELFEKDWDLYRSTFNLLIVKKYLTISVQISGTCVFELSKKGDERIDEILTENARETENISLRLRNFLKGFHRVRTEWGSYLSDGIKTFHL